jgi:hypothetical protein
MTINFRQAALSVLFVSASLLASAQDTKNLIPESYRGSNTWIARGIMDGNLIETNFRNHGELSRWSDLPWGIWPRGIGGRHIDGIAIVVAGQVTGERVKWPQYFPGVVRDTTLNPVIINYRDQGRYVGPDSYVWGWTPLNDFLNPNRFDPITGSRSMNPAMSDDPTSWPPIWPDRLGEEARGWPNSWNGMFGRGVRNADLEAFYVMDDYRDRAYHIDSSKPVKVPYSKMGIYYSDPADSTKGGLGLQVKARLLQWSNVLAEDVMFLLYTITNRGGTNHDRLYFTQLIDYGLGNEEGDENAAFDPLEDVVYGWDQDGIGQREAGGTFKLGYVGMAFLESPANATNGLDDDQDGIRDEDRFTGPGTLVTGTEQILSRVNAQYNRTDFVAKYGTIETRPAFQAGRWWTADENMDWVGYTDLNNNGQWDSGEPVNNDTGVDGLGPFDLDYPGADEGECDGIPQNGEPNFNILDVDESDQIGLRGFDLGTRPFYESGENLRRNGDTWIWERIRLSIFELGSKPAQFVADVEPFALFVSGPVRLNPGATDFFSTAWIFGADQVDFFKNRRTVQNIYNSDYNFAQPPITPRLTAVAGDGEVILAWDTLSIRSFDRFIQDFDFEGYKLYKGTDPLFTDAKLVTNVDGTPVFYKPIAQFDLKNGIKGARTVMGGDAVFNTGTDNGLAFNYVDKNVVNGKTYYYAISAYDRGLVPDSGDPIDPQETTFRVSVDLGGQVIATTPNAAVVIPRKKAAGFVKGGTTQPTDKVTFGLGTGSIKVNLVVPELADYTAQYRLMFFDTLNVINDTYNTAAFRLDNRTTGKTVIGTRPLTTVTPLQEGFVVEITNSTLAINPQKTGWVIRKGQTNELVSTDPTTLDGMTTNWVGTATESDLGAFVRSSDDYALIWVNPADSTYRPPLYFGLVNPLRIALPVFAVNLTKNKKVDYYIIQNVSDGKLSSGDTFIIWEYDEQKKIQEFRFHVRMVAKDTSASVAPTAGNRFEVVQRKPFKGGDYFDFSIAAPSIDTVAAKAAMRNIKVVPNPYLAASAFEQRSQIVGRGERRIQFTNLPASCRIRIFNIRGELLQVLDHNGGVENGAMFWDLKTSENQDLAYGVYVFHVEAKGIGQHIGKFAVIK